ncbi:6,7-dimethyl-8-ribityllumazine synthase [Microvirga sp. W0021]|uniref:6,7-dimethyl-8-ribityllumazine synthase n=1 Tax=Hohaiivirga grylli TaxID=3133970 RepID=A0ABV0BKD3_9HYPH
MASMNHAPVPVRIVPGARVLVVEARYYEDLSNALLDGASKALQHAQVEYNVLTVSGALEIPSMIAIALDAAEKAGKPYDAAVALGTVIRGETTHYDLVSEESCRGIMNLTVDRKFPIGNGIITVENDEQAWDRASPERQDKGGGAARAALLVLAIKRDLEKAGV